MVLEGKTILISGVGPGLGREIASRVLRDGGNAVIGARKADSLATAAQELDPCGERVLAHAFDITDADSCTGIVAAAAAISTASPRLRRRSRLATSRRRRSRTSGLRPR